MLSYIGFFFCIAGILLVNSQQSTKHANLFNLDNSDATVYAGGSLRQANENNFPILQGQFGSMAIITLKPGGIRQPHWHPFAWEMNYVLSGKAKWSIVGTNGQHDSFVAKTGDLVFVQQAWFHYFANANENEDLIVLIVFNSGKAVSTDDIGIVAALNGIPTGILAASFDMPKAYFEKLPRNMTQTSIILRNSAKP
ncbi:unnamed protein product [Adineta steineri]|uniref:Cupin type-1 domain-containing protein n=1 Tax=Adineta steineri TaxID=433720 RepID=A0A814F597_9BILA|nr:unnamed protein product [Adineta steineri]CAF0980076.1 unnamed protein product [Adineta steineri]CAF1123684.1 unnamed protein product [Adineta steineri]